MSPRQTRREFVCASAAALAAAASLPGATAVAAPPATSIAELRRRLRGTVLRPGDPGWPAAKALFNPRLDVSPRAIAFCETAGDVSQVVRFARRRGWPVAARSGRHSFAGYGNAVGGIVADVSRIDAVGLERGGLAARVGAGANVFDTYRSIVVEHGVAVPVGTCPTVGISGLVVGGGFGHLMRRYGVTADSLRGATVVLADGRVVRCSKGTRPGLFWALRGGGAGYGIVTELRFAVHRPGDPIAFALSFDWPRGDATRPAAALDAWQRSLPPAGRELAYARFRALCLPDGSLTATASGHWYGSDAGLRALLAPLIAAQPARQRIARKPFVDAALPDGVRRTGGVVVMPTIVHFPNYQRSDFFDALLPRDAIAALLARIEAWPGRGGSGHEGGVQLDALGGEVNRVAPGATAFVHRRNRFHCAYLSFWGSSDSAERGAACAQWTRDAYAVLHPHASGGAFQNYVDAELVDWPRAYYGQNLARLRAIKRAYDPANRFAFAQGVVPAIA